VLVLSLTVLELEVLPAALLLSWQAARVPIAKEATSADITTFLAKFLRSILKSLEINNELMLK